MLTNYERRRFRVRNSILKNNKSNRPRIVVFRSNKNIYAQLVNSDGMVLKSFSTLSLREKSGLTGIEKATFVGEGFAKICLNDGFKEVVFDKGAYSYDGRVKALANSCRLIGLQF